jgi:hypothetical protein
MSRARARTIVGPKYRAAWALIGNVQAYFRSSLAIEGNNRARRPQSPHCV